jgi:ketosteroid isomerase-like protein
MLEKTPTTKVQSFLDKFGKALEQGHIGDAVNMFQADCYWRDLVTFTWNLKTMEGQDQVRDMLQATLEKTKPSGWKVADGEEATEDGGVTTAWIQFETEVARGFGMIRLKDGLIWTLLTTMAELKGHEEKSGYTRPLGAKHGHGKDRKSWREEREDEIAELGVSRQPYVLIIGGGSGRHRAGRTAASARRVRHHHRKERPRWRLLAQALQVALPARSGLVRSPALYRLPQELANLRAERQDRRLAGNVHQGDGAQLLELHHRQESQL